MANATDTEPKVSAPFPCIDLSNPDINHSVALIKEACMDSGVFYVINHGISKEFMDEVFRQSKKLFALPMNEKMKLFWNKNFRGYVPQVPGTGDYPEEDKELFAVGVKIPEDNPDPENLFFGQYVWPPADLLPGWKENMERYLQEASEVGRAVGRLVALALGVNIDFFDQPGMLGDDNLNYLSFHHYGVKDKDPSKEKLGTAAHTDFSVITLLAIDEVSGLQICKDKFAKPQVWEDVSPLKGAFIVNAGDMLERLSNDAFKSIMHRVVFCEERFSITVFCCPSNDRVIECLPTFKSEKNPPRYAPISFGDYFSSRFSRKPTPVEA